MGVTLLIPLFLLQIMGCPSLVVIYSSMILALSRALSVYSIQLPPPSGQNQSDPCHFRAHPQPPRCFHCPGSAIGSNQIGVCGRLVGGWKPGPVRVLYIYFISSLVYFLYHIIYEILTLCIVYDCHLRGLFYFIYFYLKTI